ncbi:MAG TPA: DinB family protein [Thermoanaerobaculia bacterium]
MSEESPFRNPAAGASGAAAGYVAALVELVGGRDPLAVMDELVPEVRRLAADLDAGALATPEAPGKWSVVEVVQHLADSEIVIGYRLRVTVAEDRPALAGYDQDAWATRLGYREVELADALAQLEALRTANLRWLRTLSAEERRRVGIHAERGEESVDQLLVLVAGHDLVHRRQIERIRRAIGR